jgi:hypothetical protein
MSGFGDRPGGFEERLDDETRLLLGELWATPVGRRWLLKAGFGSAVALGVGLGGGAAGAQRPSRRRRREATDLHFAFGHLRGVSGLTLVANGERIRLVRHTRASRAALRRRAGLWRAADLSKLSHHVPRVVLPADRALLLSVHGRRRGREVVVGHIWHVPRATTMALARLSYRLRRSFKPVWGSRRRLAALGLRPSDIRSPRHVAQLETIGDTATTAVAITMLHPNIATIDPTAAATTKGLLGPTGAVTALNNYITRMQRAGRNFGSNVQVDNPDGTPAMIKIRDTLTTFSMFRFNSTDRGLQPALKAAVAAGVTAVRDNAQLGAVIDQPLEQEPAAATKTWVQSQGLVPQTQPYSGTTQLGAGIDIQVKNPGTVFGTETVVNGAYSGGQVPFKLYNNWVRWVWVYVQYLGANNANLSANPSATFPNTKYSQSLGLLPQVFTVLGVPLWDTNSIDVTLNYPQGAHTARILYCGLGSDINGGGWRQYFPSDAYPDMVAPQDEVLFASLVTGILTIGLNVFALATDLDIATTWASIKNVVAQGGVSLEAFNALVGPVVSRTVALTASETFAASVAAGGATYEDIANNGASTSNIWSILLGLGSVIPKIIFNPGAEEAWLNIAATIGGEEAVDKLEEAIPLIGEVIAVVEAVGDVATLAEVAAETIVAPWVIENEVTLTYPATVTVSRDIRASTFPATAVSWQLEAKVDGAVVLTPITGTINEGGRIRSDPLVLSVTAPFGGQSIQWSIVFLDSGGRQVGTGVSASFANNDPANPPSAVPITITQIPVPIGSSTVFKRADTTGYSSAAGGYTWSNQITDSGTVLDKGIQEVSGTAISTLAGVAGVTWEQNNRFYLRGVPVAQNGATISLGPATDEGFARRPFLLLDPFVGRTDRGNHVLLEPDATTPAYHLRKVSLDPTSGAPSWDPTVSHGTFPLPISAAALHSSGRVIAVNTDNGRLATLLPAATPRPPQAAYTAGAGTQVGLLSSPVAVAVTNPGVVLVLEGAKLQVAAFDLNGNPIPYFSATQAAPRSRMARRQRRARAAQAQAGYTLPLVSTGSYLDLAVDGAGQIYVLYYTGDGSAPADYHVDVYTQTGAVLDTNSPGVNVPHLAVDYWRSIFAANYDPLADTTTGQPHIDPALGVAEPSLSRFDPTNPSTLAARRARTARRLPGRGARPARS